MSTIQEKAMRKALDSLDDASDSWAIKIGLREMCETITSAPDPVHRMIALCKQFYVEGIYEGNRQFRGRT
jgi:hypothetical protein